MELGSQNISGFQPDQIDLAAMEDAVINLMFIGDGMSGKTQILITFAKLLLDYLQKIYISSHNHVEADSQVSTPIFQKWASQHGFNIRYGRVKWDIETVSLDTETVGLESFEYVFPYLWNNKTYRTKVLGNDVGGQNIFDHFRNVLGKMVGPDDNLIVVFDKSRELSCYNSIEQIKKVLGVITTHQRWTDESNLSRIIYCGNKVDLEEHIQSQEWSKAILETLMTKINDTTNYGRGEYSIPSLIGKNEEERDVKFTIENNQIAFPDLEALLYNAMREADSTYGTGLMSEVNTKALCRETAAQLVYAEKTMEMQEDPTQVQQLWERFKSILFQSRPLAIQYSGGVQQDEEQTSYDHVRDKWSEFSRNFPIPAEAIMEALNSMANAGKLLVEMGAFFDTNALSGSGIFKMIDSILQETLSRREDPNLQDTKRSLKGKIRKF